MNAAPNRRILLVDDMPSIHDDFRKVLAPAPVDADLDTDHAELFGPSWPRVRNDFELDSAFQGREAADRVEASIQAGRPYALAFVDMRMPPGWDGVETIEQLWKIDPKLQVVICTAHADLPWEEVLARLDVQDRLLIVKKPFDMIEVSQLANTLAAKWQLARQAESQMDSLKQAVHDLKATEVALRRSNKELGEFVYSLSHDLRTPLSVMSAFSGLLAEAVESGDESKAKHFVSRIQAGARLGEQLIDGLLFLDRVSRSPICVERVDVTGLARRLLDEQQRKDPQREVSLSVQEDMWMHGDLRLTQVVMTQLLDNAWKFTATRTPARIEVGLQEGEAGEPVCFVRDNGSGFDMAYANRLFRIFQRLHTQSEIAGTGVGLVTASRVVERHGGRIWVDTRVGEGATFYFTLEGAGS